VNLLYLIAAVLIFITLCSKAKSIRIIYLKKLLLPLVCILFITGLMLFSGTAVSAASKGIQLWFNVVFPSLFPFFVATEVLNRTSFVKALGVLLEPVMRPLFNVPGCGSFAVAMGITSGYPVGAKITSDMRENKLISKTEGERLLAFTNNSGPLFIVGAVAVGMFNMPKVGIFLLVCHILACLTVGMLFRFYGRKDCAQKQKFSCDRNLLSRCKKELTSGSSISLSNIGGVLGDAVRNSCFMMLNIGGFIIFFSVIINLLMDTGFINSVSNTLYFILSAFGIQKDVITSLISGFFELTTGTNLASKAFDTPIHLRLTAASAIIGWAGLSVHSQVLSIVSKTDISIKPYLFGKFLQGVFAAAYTFMGISIAGPVFNVAEPVFSHSDTLSSYNWYHYFLFSCKVLAVIVFILALCSAIVFAAGFIKKNTPAKQ
jgi:sporulation integral membrane protein YlbJ